MGEAVHLLWKTKILLLSSLQGNVCCHQQKTNADNGARLWKAYHDIIRSVHNGHFITTPKFWSLHVFWLANVIRSTVASAQWHENTLHILHVWKKCVVRNSSQAIETGLPARLGEIGKGREKVKPFSTGGSNTDIINIASISLQRKRLQGIHTWNFISMSWAPI